MIRFRHLLACIFLIGVISGCKAQGVSPEKFQSGLKSGTQLLDVRTPEEFEEGHIEHAKLANVHDDTSFAAGIASLDPKQPVYVYCRSGGRSSDAAAILREKGFVNVVELSGGIKAWTKAGLPLKEGPADVPAK